MRLYDLVYDLVHDHVYDHDARQTTHGTRYVIHDTGFLRCQAKINKQNELARRLDIFAATLCELESGKYYPSCEFLLNIHRVFNVNIDFLLFRHGKMFSESGGWEKTFSGIEDLAWADDEIRKFLYYFERSSIMRHHIMIQFKTMLIKDRDLIETEINEHTESKKEDQKSPD